MMGTMNSERKSKRSGSLSCAVCGVVAPLVEHHVNGRNFKDANKPWNRCWICATCHDKIHMKDSEIILEGWFSTTGGGRMMIWHKKGEPSVTGFELGN